MPINAVNLTGNVYPAGPKGDTGPANTLEIGTVEKGENASASITGEAPNQTLNLILPKGDKGEKGDTGETNSLSIGTVEKGTVPSATITGQAPNQILNLVLPKGDTGEKGEVGPRGEQGIQGNPGPINSIKIGRVEKGEEASVTIVGESPNQILNFVLPIGPKGNTGEKGDQGPKGEQGIQGETGATTSLSIGLVSSGEEASATIIGEAPDQILNLVLPKGDKGEKGNVGPQGVQGIQGETGPANSLTIGTVEKGAVPSATITGEAPNQVLNLVLPTGETAEIEAIKEEQTTQNENIEKNAEGIAQNKKDVDEELTKIKKENSLLKSQIPTGTASGNNIHLEDSSNMDFEWKLRGGSYQEVKPYNNLVKNADFKSDLNEWKASSKFGIVNKNGIKYLKISTSTAGFNRAYQGLNTIAGHKYYVAMKCIKDKAWGSAELFLSASPSDNYPQPARGITSHIYQNETSVSTILVPESSNCSIGVMFQSSNTDEVLEAYFRDFICIDLTELYGEGNEPEQTTCDNLFTFDKVAYGTSPSPYTLSQIENVGKSYNLAYTDWAEEFVNIVNSQNKAKIKEENGITFLNYSASVGYQNYDEIHFFSQIEYKENTTYSFEFDLRSEVKNVENICIEYTDGSSERLGMTNGANIWTHFRFSSNPNKTVKYLRPQYSTGSTDININTIQIIESPLFKPYNPYNQKQINIEINNDNSFDIDKIHRGYYDESRYLKGLLSNDCCGQLFEIKYNTIIRIKNTSDSSCRVSCFVYDENMNKVESIWWGDTFKSGIESSKKIDYKNNMKYVSFSIFNITGIYNPEIFRQSVEVGIYDGRVYSLDNLPKYQEHKGMEIIFPLAEGQKLYEGSYLAEDGIHNNRKQVIFNGTENWGLRGEYTNTFQVYISPYSKKGVCTHYKSITPNKFDSDTGIYLTDTSYVIISDTRFSTVDEWKTYLAEQYSVGTPVIIEYLMVENNLSTIAWQVTPYTPEQQTVIDKILYTYKNVTNISVDDELATLDITYKKDIATMFNNQAKEYNERLSNIENLLNTTETSALLLDNLESDLEKEV